MKLATIAPRTVSFYQEKTERIAAKAPVYVSSDNAAETRREAGRVHLTCRELEVLSLLCEGLPNKLIGRRLNISIGTVKIHVGNILSELAASSRLQAVVEAYRRGLVRDAGPTAYEQAYAFEPPIEAVRGYQPRALRVA